MYPLDIREKVVFTNSGGLSIPKIHEKKPVIPDGKTVKRIFSS